jgi:saccharopine dehydrogenase-like NADP-dependent oxidoreductase
VAPGISNLLAGQLHSSLVSLRSLKILVGGIPEMRVPPLDYTLTWCAEDLIEGYRRPARIRLDGKAVEVPALTGVETIEWDGVDSLEAFYTDGLRTLLRTLEDVPTMEEKTIRYAGHAEKMKFLFDMGYFDEECERTSPRSVSLCLLRRLSVNPVKDILLMRIRGIEEREGEREAVTYEVFDRADERHTAMERTTGYGCGMFAYLLFKQKIAGPGVIPPESVGMDEEVAAMGLNLLKEEGIEVIRRRERATGDMRG